MQAICVFACTRYLFCAPCHSYLSALPLPATSSPQQVLQFLFRDGTATCRQCLKKKRPGFAFIVQAKTRPKYTFQQNEQRLCRPAPSLLCLQLHALQGSALLKQADKYPGAARCIAQGLMMIQPDMIVRAKGVQTIVRQLQGCSCPFQGAVKGQPRLPASEILAAGSKNGPVKRGIVGNKAVCPLHERLYFRPYVGKGRCRAQHIPGKAVYLREPDKRRRRPDQALVAFRQNTVFYTDHAYGAG